MFRRLASSVLHKAFPGLPAATHRYEIRRDISVPMTDGTPVRATSAEAVRLAAAVRYAAFLVR